MRAFLAVAVVCLMISSAFAADFYFRGDDPNNLPSCANPADANARPPLVNFPVSKAAADLWLSRLSKAPSKYSFEQSEAPPVTEGSLPNPFNFLFPDPAGSVTATIACANGNGVCGYRVQDDTEPAGQYANCPGRLGRYPVSGDQWLDVENNDDFSISFDTPVKGFAFWATDIGDRLGSLSIRIFYNDGTEAAGSPFPLFTVDPSTPANELPSSGGKLFFGIYTDVRNQDGDAKLYKRISFDKTVPPGAATNDGFGFDDFYVLTKSIDTVGTCECLIVYNWEAGNPSCNFPQGLSVSDDECACIKYQQNLDFGVCETARTACDAQGNLPVVQDGSGNIPIQFTNDVTQKNVPVYIVFRN